MDQDELNGSGQGPRLPNAFKAVAKKAAGFAQETTKRAVDSATSAATVVGEAAKGAIDKAPEVLSRSKGGAAELTAKTATFTKEAVSAASNVAGNFATSLAKKGRVTYRSGSKKVRTVSRTIATKSKEAWIVTSNTVGDATQAAGEYVGNTEWMRSLNGHWDKDPLVKAITQAMDKAFKAGEIDLATGLKVMPNNHRILIEGHTLGQSLRHAYEVAADRGASHFDATVAWMKAYVEDLSSPAGMPIGEWSKYVYAALRKAGWSEKDARDLVTVNGSEAVDALLSGTLSALSIALAWTTQEREDFSRAIGALGMAAIVSANPVTGLVTIVGVAVAYKRDLIHKNAIQKGAFIKLAGFSVSFLLPGPAIVTALCGIVVAVYLNKTLDSERSLGDQVMVIAQSSYEAAYSQVASIINKVGAGSPQPT